MYTPTHFKQEDPALNLAFMQRYNFATLVSLVDGVPFASHLPFVVETGTEGSWRLLAHMAKNNPQWQTLEEQTSLVIFAEPHAYVSPGLYEKELNVPTWNYIAVHVYGRARLITDTAEAFQLLEKQMQTYEAAYLDQWNRLPEAYKNALLQGITAFEIPVDKIEEKWKLSQNKSANDRQTVAAHLANSEDTAAAEVARYMAQLFQP